MSDDKKSLTSYFTKKVIIGLSVIATLFAIVAGIWGFETHYATNKRVDIVVSAHAKDLKQLETKISGTLERSQYKMDVRYFQFLHEQLARNMLEVKRQMRRYPEDEVLKEDYRDLVQRKQTVKGKLDAALEKIN
jgi:hypothetical protein